MESYAIGTLNMNYNDSKRKKKKKKKTTIVINK